MDSLRNKNGAVQKRINLAGLMAVLWKAAYKADTASGNLDFGSVPTVNR